MEIYLISTGIPRYFVKTVPLIETPIHSQYFRNPQCIQQYCPLRPGVHLESRVTCHHQRRHQLMFCLWCHGVAMIMCHQMLLVCLSSYRFQAEFQNALKCCLWLSTIALDLTRHFPFYASVHHKDLLLRNFSTEIFQPLFCFIFCLC